MLLLLLLLLLLSLCLCLCLNLLKLHSNLFHVLQYNRSKSKYQFLKKKVPDLYVFQIS